MASSIEGLYLTIGRRLAKARADSGLTQAQVGMRLRPRQTRASLANIESAKQRVMVHTLIQLSRIYGVAVGRLVGK